MTDHLLNKAFRIVWRENEHTIYARNFHEAIKRFRIHFPEATKGIRVYNKH